MNRKHTGCLASVIAIAGVVLALSYGMGSCNRAVVNTFEPSDDVDRQVHQLSIGDAAQQVPLARQKSPSLGISLDVPTAFDRITDGVNPEGYGHFYACPTEPQSRRGMIPCISIWPVDPTREEPHKCSTGMFGGCQHFQFAGLDILTQHTMEKPGSLTTHVAKVPVEGGGHIRLSMTTFSNESNYTVNVFCRIIESVEPLEQDAQQKQD